MADALAESTPTTPELVALVKELVVGLARANDFLKSLDERVKPNRTVAVLEALIHRAEELVGRVDRW